MRTEDGCIIYRCLNGEPEAFGLLVDKYKESIYAFVYTKLLNFQDAQDITQEVFLQAYRDLRNLRRWESFIFWLYRIAHNCCMRLLQARSKRPDLESIEDQDPTVLDNSSIDSYRENQVNESLRETLKSLPETYRQVLILHYFGGMSSYEIARALGTSSDAVRKRLSRAREHLKAEMVAVIGTAFADKRLPAGFTFRVVEAVKKIGITPLPRMAGLPWGLSLAAGIIITVLSLNPQIRIQSSMYIPEASPLHSESKVLKTGEIPVDIIQISPMLFISSNSGNDKHDGRNSVSEILQENLSMSPHGQGGIWVSKTDMPTPRARLSTCVMDGKIYAIGGLSDSWTFSAAVEEYDPATDRWTRKADMLTARFGLSTCVVNGRIYAIGGGTIIDGEWVCAPTEEYDPAADTWTKKADMPTVRVNHCASVINGKIYVIGGGDVANNDLSVVEEYDPASDKWTRKTDMPTVRWNPSSNVVNGKIYVIGGGVDTIGKSEVEEYDPATDTWTKKANMPTARAALSTSLVKGRIYAIGGVSSGKYYSTVEVYDPATDTWVKEADMPTARAYLSASMVNGKIYALGGSQQWPQPLSAVEEYTPEDKGEEEMIDSAPER